MFYKDIRELKTNDRKYHTLLKLLRGSACSHLYVEVSNWQFLKAARWSKIGQKTLHLQRWANGSHDDTRENESCGKILRGKKNPQNNVNEVFFTDFDWGGVFTGEFFSLFEGLKFVPKLVLFWTGSNLNERAAPSGLGTHSKLTGGAYTAPAGGY